MVDWQEANVDVVITHRPSGGFNFALQSNLGSGQELVFKNYKKGEFYMVNFNIVDTAGSGLKFPQDLEEAMWVKTLRHKKDPCPDAPIYWDQFEAVEVKNNYMTLRVKNWNSFKRLFAFALRFTVTPASGPYVIFDPIGDNRNGPSKWNLASSVVIGAAIGAACGTAVAGLGALIAYDLIAK